MNMNFNLSTLDEDILNTLQKMLQKNSALYVVGGSLRDNILGKKSYDIDFIVQGQNAIKLDENFAQKTGKYFILLDEEHEIARVVDTDKLHYFDFARCENDDINCDLARRDLTINAIAA